MRNHLLVVTRPGRGKREILNHEQAVEHAETQAYDAPVVHRLALAPQSAGPGSIPATNPGRKRRGRNLAVVGGRAREDLVSRWA